MAYKSIIFITIAGIFYILFFLKICQRCIHSGKQEEMMLYLQWTVIGPTWPNCSLVLWTWPMKSMNPSPDLGTPCSGQSVNWNWRIVRDCPSYQKQCFNGLTNLCDHRTKYQLYHFNCFTQDLKIKFCNVSHFYWILGMSDDCVAIGRTYPSISDLEFPQDILRHVVLGHWIHHKILIAGRSLTGPVLVTLLLKKPSHNTECQDRPRHSKRS